MKKEKQTMTVTEYKKMLSGSDKLISSAKNIRRDEENSQIELFKWIELASKKLPLLKYVFHIPNGGLRHVVVAIRLKQMGTMPGVFDIACPVPKNGYTSLWIEMKSGKKGLTENQKNFKSMMEEMNALCLVCYSAKEAKDALMGYLYPPKVTLKLH